MMSTYETYAAAALSGLIASDKYHISECIKLAHEYAQAMIDATPKTYVKLSQSMVGKELSIIRRNNRNLTGNDTIRNHY